MTRWRSANRLLVLLVLAGACGNSGPLLGHVDGSASADSGEGGGAVDALNIADARGTWIRVMSGSKSRSVAGISVLANDDILVAGSFESSIVLGSGEATEATLSSTVMIDVFIARLSGNGTLKWAASIDSGVSAGARWPSGPLNSLGDVMVVAGAGAGATTYDYPGGPTSSTTDPGELWAYYSADGQAIRVHGTMLRTLGAIAHPGANTYSLLVLDNRMPEKPTVRVRRLNGKHEDLDPTPKLSNTPSYTMRSASAFAGGADGALAVSASFAATDTPPFGLPAGTGDRVCLASLRADDSVVWSRILSEADQGGSVSVLAGVGHESGPWFVVVGGSAGITLPIPAGGGETRIAKGRFLVCYGKDGDALWSRILPDGFKALAEAPDNSVWILGALTGEQSVNIPERNLSLNAGGTPLSYLMQYSKEGALVKVIVLRGARNPNLAVLSDGSLAIAGEFADSVRIGEGEPWEIDADAPRSFYNVFVARCLP
jgi:hypothetical protein